MNFEYTKTHIGIIYFFAEISITTSPEFWRNKHVVRKLHYMVVITQQTVLNTLLTRTTAYTLVLVVASLSPFSLTDRQNLWERGTQFEILVLGVCVRATSLLLPHGGSGGRLIVLNSPLMFCSPSLVRITPSPRFHSLQQWRIFTLALSTFFLSFFFLVTNCV